MVNIGWWGKGGGVRDTCWADAGCRQLTATSPPPPPPPTTYIISTTAATASPTRTTTTYHHNLHCSNTGPSQPPPKPAHHQLISCRHNHPINNLPPLYTPIPSLIRWQSPPHQPLCSERERSLRLVADITRLILWSLKTHLYRRGPSR